MPESVSSADYAFVRDLLRAKAGHDLGDGKEYLVESRLAVAAESFRLPGVAALLDRCRSLRERDLETAILEAMMTGETSFFRNPGVFSRLKSDVLPALIAARRGERRLRIWSAGCSTGQEPCSVAMLLVEEFPEVVRDWDVAIAATDLSAAGLRMGKLGMYNAVEIRRGLSEARLARFFDAVGGRWRVRPEIARLVRFDRVNLIDPLPFHGDFDLILLRNVLIYFEAEAKRKVFRAVREAIRDDGFLFLGDSETILGASEDFVCGPTGADYYRPAPR